MPGKRRELKRSLDTGNDGKCFLTKCTRTDENQVCVFKQREKQQKEKSGDGIRTTGWKSDAQK